MEREHSMFLFPLSGGRDRMEKKEGIVLPEFIVAGRGRKVQGLYRERETKGGHYKRGGGKEGEQQFDSRFVSHLLYTFFFCFPAG